jgi:hypothetical protein
LEFPASIPRPPLPFQSTNAGVSVRPTPVLLLAYNRPEKLERLIDALRRDAPPLVYVVVDGPKSWVPGDEERVEAVRAAAARIDWDADVRTRFRESNVGLRRSVVDAVGWVTGEHGEVIVIEDDVVPGPDVLAYLAHMLERYRDDERVAHVSGYNVVPAEVLHGRAGSRFSVYPESFLWATWARAWAHYDDALAWPGRGDGPALRRTVASTWAAARWRQNFADARADRIASWAYRWIASMWSRGSLVVSPNVNLATYIGLDDGTHTVTRPKWRDLPVYDGPRAALLTDAEPLDPVAERWISRVVFGGTAVGVARGVAISVVLGARKRWRARRRAALGS